MSISLTIDGRGLRGFEDALERAALKMRRLHRPLEAIGRYLLLRASESFAREESPDGAPWAALSTKYVNASPKKGDVHKGGRGGSAHPILLRQGYLKQSIQQKASDTWVAIGSNRQFRGGKSAAAIHQLGGQAGRGHAARIPARPFFGANDEDVRRAGGILLDYLKSPSPLVG